MAVNFLSIMKQVKNFCNFFYIPIMTCLEIENLRFNEGFLIQKGIKKKWHTEFLIIIIVYMYRLYST